MKCCSCCKKKNKVADKSEPSPGCFPKFKKEKSEDNWAERRRSVMIAPEEK